MLDELEGDLAGARKHLQKAKKLLGERDLVVAYEEALRLRRVKAKKLAKQL